jgi:hypothetical protein
MNIPSLHDVVLPLEIALETLEQVEQPVFPDQCQAAYAALIELEQAAAHMPQIIELASNARLHLAAFALGGCRCCNMSTLRQRALVIKHLKELVNTTREVMRYSNQSGAELKPFPRRTGTRPAYLRLVPREEGGQP